MKIQSIPAVWFGTGIFIVVIVLAGWFTPGYSHVHQAISELGAVNAPYPWVVRWLGFIPLGISFMGYAFQSRRFYSNAIPFTLYLFIGLAILLAGVFPTDPHGRRDTTSGLIHALAGIVLLTLLSITPCVHAIRGMYQKPPHTGLLIFSFCMGLLVTIFLVMLPNGISPQLVTFHQKVLGSYFQLWYPMHGLHQRLLLSLFFVWLFACSFYATGDIKPRSILSSV